MEYYTGINFTIAINYGGKNINIINGGRYDNLIKNLGGKKIPAVRLRLIFKNNYDHVASLISQKWKYLVTGTTDILFLF